MTRPRFRTAVFALLAIVVIPIVARAQSAADLEGPGWTPLERGVEVRLARSAAPADVSAGAAIWLLEDGTFHEAFAGSIGNACIVMRSYPESIEPVCYDAEGARTILPIEIRRFEWRNEGVPWTTIHARVEAAIKSGDLHVPTRPALSWMLSSAQVLYAPNGMHVGAWKPHIMLYVPGMTNVQLGMFDLTYGNVQVADEGLPTAHLIAVVPDFVDPANM